MIDIGYSTRAGNKNTRLPQRTVKERRIAKRNPLNGLAILTPFPTTAETASENVIYNLYFH